MNRGQHSQADEYGFVEWAHPLDQLASDVISEIEYSPYSWVRRLDIKPAPGVTFRGDRFVANRVMVVGLTDSDDDQKTITKAISLREFMGAIRAICAKHRLVVDEETAGDIDADLADQILQKAVYGEVIFG